MTVICVTVRLEVRSVRTYYVALPFRDSFATITVRRGVVRHTAPLPSPLPSAAAALALDSRADMWSPRATNDWFEALANGQRSVEDPSGRLRNYAAGCLINVRQIMADHRDAQ